MKTADIPTPLLQQKRHNGGVLVFRAINDCYALYVEDSDDALVLTTFEVVIKGTLRVWMVGPL